MLLNIKSRNPLSLLRINLINFYFNLTFCLFSSRYSVHTIHLHVQKHGNKTSFIIFRKKKTALIPLFVLLTLLLAAVRSSSVKLYIRKSSRVWHSYRRSGQHSSRVSSGPRRLNKLYGFDLLNMKWDKLGSVVVSFLVWLQSGGHLHIISNSEFCCKSLHLSLSESWEWWEIKLISPNISREVGKHFLVWQHYISECSLLAVMTTLLEKFWLSSRVYFIETWFTSTFPSHHRLDPNQNWTFSSVYNS